MRPEEQRLHDEARRGEEASRMLESQVYVDSFRKVKESIVDAMENVPVGDKETQHILVLSLQLLNKIEKNIKTVAETGKMAKMQLNSSFVDKIRGIL